jgi:flavin-dependent dehydrogenase
MAARFSIISKAAGVGRVCDRARLRKPVSQNPFEEFQRFKTHPAIRGFFEGGRRIAYGAPRSTKAGSSRSRASIFRAGR